MWQAARTLFFFRFHILCRYLLVRNCVLQHLLLTAWTVWKTYSAVNLYSQSTWYISHYNCSMPDILGKKQVGNKMPTLRWHRKLLQGTNPSEITEINFFFFFLIYLFFYIYIYFFIVMQLQLYAFSPHPSTRPQVNPPPSPLATLPLGFVHVSCIVVPVIPSTHCPRPHPPLPPWLLLDCS